jgi:hypothetical protein
MNNTATEFRLGPNKIEIAEKIKFLRSLGAPRRYRVLAGSHVEQVIVTKHDDKNEAYEVLEDQLFRIGEVVETSRDLIGLFDSNSGGGLGKFELLKD